MRLNQYLHPIKSIVLGRMIDAGLHHQGVSKGIRSRPGQGWPGGRQQVDRILRPGALFVFTAFEDRGIERYRLPMQDNGFNIEVYEEKPDWRSRQLATYEGTLAEQDALIEEMGEGALSLIAEAKDCLADGLVNTQHVFVVSRRM
jgi:hypothetical protein